jgi:tetratricopeptide (TPR) repeat protein
MHVAINLFDHLLETGRRSQEMGRHRDALAALTRLSSFLDVPAEIAEEAQARLGELHLKRRKFVRARRHLTAALRHRPDDARYHHLMGQACQEEDRGDLERAAKHYRRSLRLDATNVQCLVDFGLLEIRLGQSEEGLAKLRDAATLASDDPTVTAKLVKGLRHLGKPDEARAEVRAAMFRNPRNPQFRRLWNEFQYRELRQKQRARRAEAEPAANDDEPVLLPFVMPETGEGMPFIRQDGPATAAAPHVIRIPRKKDRREVK